MIRSRSNRFLRAVCTIVFFAVGMTGATLPVNADGFDWHNLEGQNWLTPARGQHYGDCHVFATFSMVESKYKLTRNDPVYSPDMSEWNYCHAIVDLGYWPSVSYFTSTGVVSEAECPYDPVGVWCEGGWPLSAGSQNRVWKTANNNTALADGTTAGLKAFVKTNGPSFLRLQTTNDLFDSVSSMYGNTRTPSCGPTNHWMALVGYQDDPNVPTGGYWILKNSWGDYGASHGYGYIPYGFLESHFNPEAPDTGLSFTAPVYYTGSMVSANWNGGAGTWSSGGGNWTKTAVNEVPVTPAAYAWENKESSATFGGAGGMVTLSGTAIVHGMTVNSTGYSFTGGALTVTAGGITANQSTTISSPLTIGGPQTWTVAGGMTLAVNGPLHTVISDTTVAGAGNVTIAGVIDGGGILNTYGAKPGGIIKNNTGSLTLTGASNYGGDITVGTGTLSITPTGGAAAAYSGAWFGSGATDINSTGTTSIGGGASNYSGAITLQGGGTLQFVPADKVKGTFSGVINGDSPVTQNGPGTTVLSASNTYTGDTTITAGALQAITSTSGKGLPVNSFLKLDGGVLQNNNSTTTFTRNLGTAGSAFQWTANGGGFSAYGRVFTVRVNNGASTLTWGTDVGTQIVGTLKFGSTSATSLTDFQNGIDLNAATRTIQVDDNPNTTSDYAQVSGVISGAGTSSSLTKTGPGKLLLSAVNNYGGATTISGGALQATIGVGIPSASLINLDGGVYQSNSAYIFDRSIGSADGAVQWTDNGGGFAAGFGALTVNIGSGADLTWGSTVGTHLVGTLRLSSNTATNSTTFQNAINLNGATRTINVDDNPASSADYAVLSGLISGSGSLIKTGVGRLVINGSSANTYSGTTTIKGGTVELNKTTGPAIPGNLILDGGESCFVKLVGANQLPSTASLTWINAKTPNYQEIELLGHNQTVTGISDAGGRGVIENTWNETGYANCTLTVNNSANCSFNGYLRNTAYGSGTLALAKSGEGTLTLSGGNISYTGGTTITGGKLVLRDVFSADASNPTFLARNIANDATLEFNTYLLETAFSGAISGTGALNKTGDFSLVLSGPTGNTYAGTTTLSGGSVVLNKTSGYAIPGNVVFSAAGSTYWLYLQGNNQIAPAATATWNSGTGAWRVLQLQGHTQTLAGISSTIGTYSVIQNTQGETGIGNSVLTIDNSTNCAYNGVIRNSAGGSGTLALVKSGNGTLTLTGTEVGQYTGGLTVNKGTLNYSGGTLPVCNYTITGGTLNIGTKSRSIRTFKITGGALDGTGALTSNAAYDVQAGTVNAILAGTNIALNKTGDETAILAGNNTLTGLTTVSAGTLQLGIGSISGNVSGGIAIGANGTLVVNRSSSITYSSKVSGTGTLVKTGLSTLTMWGANTFSGNVVVNNGTLNYSGNSSLPAGNYTVTAGTLNLGTLSQSIGAFQITGGAITGAGTLTSSSDYGVQGGLVEAVLGGNAGLVKTQDGVATLKGANTYAGATRIEAGTLILSGNGQINPVSTIDNGSTFIVADGTHALGDIIGTGSTLVGDLAQLSARSIVQDTLTIGGDYSALVASSSLGNFQSASVPEPSALTLFVSFAAVFAAAVAIRTRILRLRR